MATNNVINNAFADNFTAPNKVSKNLMPAGNFTTNPWQRGTSFTTVPPASLYYADRFRWITTAAVTAGFNITKEADSPTVAEAGILSTSCVKFACTTAQAVIAAGDIIYSYYGLEGYDFANIAQRPFTFSFWVKSNITGIFCVNFRNSIADQSYVAEYTINQINTWEKKTIVVSASPSAGTWDYTNGLGLSINFVFACGSTFQTGSPDVWTSSNVLATANQTNFASSNTNTIQFALIQLEAGTVATPYQILSESQIRDYCNRYFCSTFPNGTTVAQASGVLSGALTFAKMNTSSSTSGNAYAQTRISMRTSPTVVTYNPINANANWYNVTLGADSGAVQQFSPSYRGINIRNTLVAGDLAGHIIALHVSFSAEL